MTRQVKTCNVEFDVSEINSIHHLDDFIIYTVIASSSLLFYTLSTNCRTQHQQEQHEPQRGAVQQGTYHDLFSNVISIRSLVYM